MRRQDKEITDIKAIENIIERSLVCRLALSDNGQPYIVPLSFGYQDKTLYFHVAREGRKLDILRNNNNVCFEFDIDQKIVGGKKACNWSMKYRSVIGFGKAKVLDDFELKKTALDCIMKHYADEGPFEFPVESLQRTVIIKVDIEQMSGKVSGYEPGFEG